MFCLNPFARIHRALRNLERIIVATLQEHAQALRDLKAQNEKARAEIVQKIADLEAALVAAGGTTPEVDAAMADLKASVQADDDMNPDVPPVPTP